MKNRPYINLVGKRFNRLLVLKVSDIRKNNRRVWECLCDCGNRTKVYGDNLKRGHTRSCGCFFKERIKVINLTHGMENTRPYSIWISMKTRCENSKVHNYLRYGGRGIKVCDRWLKFENFWADMKQGYANNLSINRIDNDGNYNPDNCKWSTPKEQANNKRNTIYLSFNGSSKTIGIWAKETGIKYETIRARIKNYNWQTERALTEGVSYVI